MASRGVNKVILIGNLGQDPEVRYMPNGKAVASITVATSEVWTDQQGTKHYTTEIIVGEMQMLSGRDVANGQQSPPASNQPPANQSPAASSRTTSEPPPMGFDDEIPFAYVGISGRSLLLSM